MTPYTGNPNATEAPSPPPGPQVFPIANLPADTDPPNAATFAQAYKVLADFIAWLVDKIVTTGTAFVVKLERWRSMRGHVRFVVDHWGKPGGALYDWVEQWAPGTPFDLPGIVNTAVGRWHLLSNAAACNFSSSQPGVSAGINASNTSRAIQVTVDGSGSGNRSEVRLNDDAITSLFTADALITMEIEITPHTVLSVNWVVGFTNVGELVNGINNGAFFIRPSGAGTNWHARTIVGGVQTDVDTGILGSADALHTFGIHLVGGNVDDASAPRVLFFIDGVQKANITTNIPTGASAIPVFGGTATGVTANPTILGGPVRYSQITSISTP